ncbi:hypothetical protein OY671_003324 [Metschnikowia pulcherrima]|nr:hypothetical protein OY671_003324 [Metschnikowia pulcherrima]
MLVSKYIAHKIGLRTITASLGKLHEPKNGVSFEGRTVDAILTIVDKFSNRVHFYAVSPTLSTDDLVQLLLHHHFPLHGLPNSIKSDRGPQFTIAAFRSSLKQLKMESILSLARHQQSNG